MPGPMELASFLRQEQLAIKTTGRGTDGSRYEVLAAIDRGGMGELFLAKHISADAPPQYVVIKRIIPALLEDEKYVKMFVAEAEIMARLDHPNIVRLIDRPVFEDQQCLALEYVRGRNVHQILAQLGDKKRMEPALVLRIMSQVLRGLDYAHRFQLEDGRPLNLVHRDMTPGNVLVSFGGEVKLADFGIAKHEMSGVLTTVGIVKGKARYLSPEQVVGDPATPRSDIFAAACVTLEMLTGKPVFDAPSVPKTLYSIVNGEHAPIDALVGFHAPLLVQLLTRAMATDASARLGTARELAEGLEAAARLLGRPCDESALGAYLRELFHETEAEDAGIQEDTAPSAKSALLGGAALLAREGATEDARTEIAGPLGPKPLLASGELELSEIVTATRDTAYGTTVPSGTFATHSETPSESLASPPETTHPRAVDEALSVLMWLQSRQPRDGAQAGGARDPAEAPLASPEVATLSPAPRAPSTDGRPRNTMAVFTAGITLGVLGTLAGQIALKSNLAASIEERLTPPQRLVESPRIEAIKTQFPPKPQPIGTASTAAAGALAKPPVEHGRPFLVRPDRAPDDLGRGLRAAPGPDLALGQNPSEQPSKMALAAKAPAPLPPLDEDVPASAEVESEGASGVLELLEPRGASVRLDGVWLKQRVPIREVEVRPGRHRVRIVSKTARQELIFNVEPGEHVDLTKPVRRKLGNGTK